MNEKAEREFDDRLGSARSWAEDRTDLLLRSRRTAWRVAAGASAIAVLQAVALVTLLPLKTVEPYTLLVDRQTGYVEALKPLERQTITADAALTRSFLVQYVIAREGFSLDAVQADYRKVALWSADEARQQYIASMQASNPESPLTALPRSSVVTVNVKSMSSLSPSSALIRFSVQRLDRGGRVTPPTDWVALVSFTYSGEPMSVSDRLINPLGFKVTRYRRNAETLPQPAVPAPAQPQPATGVAPVSRGSLAPAVGFTAMPRATSAGGAL